jgi:hypothetical protein
MLRISMEAAPISVTLGGSLDLLKPEKPAVFGLKLSFGE